MQYYNVGSDIDSIVVLQRWTGWVTWLLSVLLPILRFSNFDSNNNLQVNIAMQSTEGSAT